MKKKSLKIGVLGLTFASANLGCQALAYSFFEVLGKIANENHYTIDLYVIDEIGLKSALTKKNYLKEHLPDKKSPLIKSHLIWEFYDKKIIVTRTLMRKCDLIFDFTAGDSFTDIYGQKRFEERTGMKELVISMGIPLVLGSQTVGPFQLKNVDRAAKVIRESHAVFVRDEKSYSYVREIANVTPILTTDVAFFLPYKLRHKKPHTIGINPSGLLWRGGYTENNQFGLTVDYRKYLVCLIDYLINNMWEIHLIPHVLTENLDVVDNDLIACNELKQRYPSLIVAPLFKTPMEAKSYISGMEIFTGARMHATIGAFSSNTTVIPFSYSRKFEGLFESLNYPYVISGTSLSTEEAIEKTIQYLNERSRLKICLQNCMDVIDQKNQILETEVSRVIESVFSK